MRLDYDIVDVFTDRPFAGNQLAVVHGADDLSTGAVPGARAGVRLLRVDVPGVGGRGGRRVRHPDLHPRAGDPVRRATRRSARRGCCASRGLLTADDAVQVCGAGRIGVRFDGDRGRAAPRRRATWPAPLDAATWSATLLGDLGLSPSTTSPGEAWVAGCGLTLRARAGQRGGGGAGGPVRPAVRASSPSGSAAARPARGPAGRGEPVRRRRRGAACSTCTRGCSCPGSACPRTRRPARPPPGSGWRWSRPACCPRAGATTSPRASRWAGRPAAGRVEADRRHGDALPRRRPGAARCAPARSPP